MTDRRTNRAALLAEPILCQGVRLIQSVKLTFGDKCSSSSDIEPTERAAAFVRLATRNWLIIPEMFSREFSFYQERSSLFFGENIRPFELAWGR
jgi:hypothetical protein